MIAPLALALTLAWTTPATDTLGNALAPVAIEQAVIRQRQSPLWLATHGCLTPASDPRVWRYVIAEADTQTVAHVWALPGAACSCAIDTTGGPWIWEVQSRQAHSAWSERGNEVWR